MCAFSYSLSSCCWYLYLRQTKDAWRRKKVKNKMNTAKINKAKTKKEDKRKEQIFFPVTIV
jgi:hypothetical protein